MGFLCRLTGRRAGAGCFTGYVLLLLGIQGACTAAGWGTPPALAMALAALYGMSRLTLGNGPARSCTAAVLAVYVSQMSAGAVNSLEALAAPRPAAPPGVRAAERPPVSPTASQSPSKPLRDEYVPEDRGRGEERCTANTDKVDRELRELRAKREKLEARLSSETDEVKIRELERALSQVESELRRKDNDAYRRRHTVFTEG